MVESALKAQLEEACQDLWWSSEADYPVRMVWIADASAATQPTVDDMVFQVADIENAEALTTVDVEDFFARSLTPKPWHTPEDKAQLTQLQTVKDLLTQSLQNLTVYRYGEVEIDVYVLGHTSTGAIAGIKTRLVET